MKHSGRNVERAACNQHVQYLTIFLFQLNALRAISTCSGKPENCQILHDHDIETTIMTVLGGENPGVLAQACLTVSTMAANPLVKETFTKIGVVQVRRIVHSSRLCLDC